MKRERLKGGGLRAFTYLAAAILLAYAILLPLPRMFVLTTVLMFSMPILTVIVVIALLTGGTFWFKNREAGWRNTIPALMLLAALLLFAAQPFPKLYRHSEFRALYDRRQEVVQLVAAGELDSGKLAGRLAVASEDGDVQVDRSSGRLAVLFYYSKGMSQNYAAIVYTSDDKPLDRKDFGGNATTAERLAPGWYYVLFS